MAAVDVTLKDVLYTCCYCTEYNCWGTSCHYWPYRQEYDNQSEANRDDDDCGAYMWACVGAVGVSLFLLFVYFFSVQDTAYFYWTTVVYADIIVCSVMFCSLCICACRPLTTGRSIGIYLSVHAGTVIIYLIGVGGGYTIKRNDPWNRTDWLVGFATIIGILVGLFVFILLIFGIYKCCLLAKQRTIERLAAKQHLQQINSALPTETVIVQVISPPTNTTVPTAITAPIPTVA